MLGNYISGPFLRKVGIEIKGEYAHIFTNFDFFFVQLKSFHPRIDVCFNIEVNVVTQTFYWWVYVKIG
jgi:hypothetical protein